MNTKCAKSVRPTTYFGIGRKQILTLSCLGWRLGGVLSLDIHISPTNGPIDMVSIAKLVYYVLPIHFACSIIQIGLLVAKLQQVYGLRGRYGS